MWARPGVDPESWVETLRMGVCVLVVDFSGGTAVLSVPAPDLDLATGQKADAFDLLWGVVSQLF